MIPLGNMGIVWSPGNAAPGIETEHPPAIRTHMFRYPFRMKEDENNTEEAVGMNI
jgi:hypothetical protein